MIFAKSSFNPNISYINVFNNGNLMEYSDWMENNTINFISADNVPINMSLFYLFNVQIPSSLDKLVLTNNYTEMNSNFAKIVNLFDHRIDI
jgi:hypothetical protein